MSRALILILLLVGLIAASPPHKYTKKKGGKGHHYWNATENDALYTWEQAEGYLECEEFLNFPNLGQETKDLKLDERGYVRKQGKPRALEHMCPTRDCVPDVNSTEESPGCGFKRRTLKSGNWTTTNINLGRVDWFRDAYKRLAPYRGGEGNSLKTRIGMGVPIITKWYLDANYTVISATMSFYVPSLYQKNPPASLNKDVRVEQWDEVVTYSRTWGGTRDDVEYWPQSAKQFDYLSEALSREDLKWYSYLRLTGSYIGRKEVMLADRDIVVREIKEKGPDSRVESE